MPSHAGPNTLGESNLVFAYDTGDVSNSYKGEPTTNYITTMAANLGGNVSLSYPLNVYICTAQETNVVDPTAPGGQYSRFTGNTDSDNNQLFTAFVDGGVNARNTTVAYSVYLKGSGTCHLTVYSDIAGYNITSTITLTSQWTRYSIVQAVGNYTTYAWAAVRGILTTTNVYVAAQHIEFKTHITPFINGTRSITQGLLPLIGNSTIDLSNVSFDSNAQMVFDGTDDYIPLSTITLGNASWTIECIVLANANSYNILSNSSGGPVANAFGFYGNKIYYQNYDGSWQTHYGNTTLSFGTYYHFTWVNINNTMQMYVNGQTDSSIFNSYTTNGGPVDAIGRNWFSYFNGKLPIFKYYNTTLSSNQIKQNYQQYKTRFNLS
jgi:hypothetical protein